MSQLTSSRSPVAHPRGLLQRLSQSVLLSIGAIVLLQPHTPAAEQITLTSGTAQAAVSIADLQAFVADRQTPPALQQFLQQTSEPPEQVRQVLAFKLPSDRVFADLSFDRATDQFWLIQLDQILGVTLRQENLEPLQAALTAAATDSQISLIELIEQYPEPKIRVEISRMMQLYRSLQPIVATVDKFLPDLICDCGVVPTPSDFNWPQPPPALSPSGNCLRPVAVAPAIAPRSPAVSAALFPRSADEPRSLSLPQSGPLLSAEQLILTYGPFRPSFAIADLQTLAETGEIPRGWAIYLQLARVQPEQMRAILTQPVPVESQFLDRLLNSLIGDYLLFQVGQLVHTRSDRANVQALRAALMRSALNDDQISLLEIVQNYPLPQVYIDGIRLVALTRQFNQAAGTGAGAIGGGLALLQNWLFKVQVANPETLCDCQTNSP